MPRNKRRRKPSPNLMDDGMSMIGLPRVIKDRLTSFKKGTEPYYKVVERLMDFYEEGHNGG